MCIFYVVVVAVVVVVVVAVVVVVVVAANDDEDVDDADDDVDDDADDDVDDSDDDVDDDADDDEEEQKEDMLREKSKNPNLKGGEKSISKMTFLGRSGALQAVECECVRAFNPFLLYDAFRSLLGPLEAQHGKNIPSRRLNLTQL